MKRGAVIQNRPSLGEGSGEGAKGAARAGGLRRWRYHRVVRNYFATIADEVGA